MEWKKLGCSYSCDNRIMIRISDIVGRPTIIRICPNDSGSFGEFWCSMLAIGSIFLVI